MKITMYELLGMIKDDKAPKKVKYINSIWEYDKETKDYFHDYLWLIYSMNSIGLTEREVEILEEEKKIPEKLEYWQGLDKVKNDCELDDLEYAIKYGNYNFEMFFDKINEIIDYLKSKGDE